MKIKIVLAIAIVLGLNAYGGTSSPLANKVLKFKISLLDIKQ